MNSKDIVSPFKRSVNFNVLSTHFDFCNTESAYHKQARVSNKVRAKRTGSFNPSIWEYYSALPRYLHMNKENNSEANPTQNTGLY